MVFAPLSTRELSKSGDNVEKNKLRPIRQRDTLTGILRRDDPRDNDKVSFIKHFLITP